MNLPFTRTPTGIVGKWRFYQSPTIWVEGPTDIWFFEPLVADLQCRMEPFHGAENARALIEDLKLNGFPYAVVLDGDYTIPRRWRSPHRYIIRLTRYSFENVLWEKEPINLACLRHAQPGERGDVIGSEFERLTKYLEEKLFQLVALDIAARTMDPSPKVLPDRIESLLVREDATEIDIYKVGAIAGAVDKLLETRVLEQAKDDFARVVKTCICVDIIKGLLLFGVLRRMFTECVTRIRGKKAILNDEALTQILAEMVWRKVPSVEHKKLKRKVRAVVRLLQKEILKVM